MGLVLRKMEDYETAIYCYTQELQYSNDNFRTLNNRGYCLAKLGRFDEAIKDYSKAINLDC